MNLRYTFTSAIVRDLMQIEAARPQQIHRQPGEVEIPAVDRAAVQCRTNLPLGGG